MTMSVAQAEEMRLDWVPHELARPAEPDIIGHHDLAPWNIVFEGNEVVGIIDWDAAGPSTRVWDLAYAAYQFVPFHPAEDLAAWGWADGVDRRRRLDILLDEYGLSISREELVNAAVLRIASMGAYIAQQVERRNPMFDVHAREGHAAGYYKAVGELARMREELI